MTAALTMARALAARGLSVIPVPPPVPGAAKGRPGDGKVPAVAWKQYQERRPTEDELSDWFAAEQNIAVITGSVSGIVVVDADSAEAVSWVRRNMLRTPWRVRTARGLHLYYRHPGVAVRNRARIETRNGKLALDVRGDGGYVIRPGSLHASGHTYTAEGDWSVPVAKLPAFWIGLLRRPERAVQSRPRPSTPLPTGDVAKRARAYLAAIPVPVIGQASDAATFGAAARLVRGFGLGETEATSLLWEWCGGRTGWTWEWLAEKVRNAAKYGDEEIGGLRDESR